jgi:FkbM family methyltransferase
MPGISESKLPWASRALLAYGSRLPNHWGKWRVHHLLRQWLVPPLDGEMEVTRGGLRLRLNPADHVHNDVFWLGAKDTWEVELGRRLLPEGGVFLDIGSNFGWYSLTLAREVGPGGQVHAFEPHPPTQERLQANIALNQLGGIIRPVPLALSDQPGQAPLVFREGNTGATRIESSSGEAGDGGQSVAISTLDEYASRVDLSRIDLIKLDVEGNEPRVLRGGERTLSRFRPPLLVEVNPPVLEEAGSSAGELADALNGQGYDAYQIIRRRLAKIDGPLVPPARDGYFNILAWPRERGPAPGAQPS